MVRRSTLDYRFVCGRESPGVGGGDPHVKWAGILVGKFELKRVETNVGVAQAFLTS